MFLRRIQRSLTVLSLAAAAFALAAVPGVAFSQQLASAAPARQAAALAPGQVGEVTFAVGAPQRASGGALEPVRRGAAVRVGDVVVTGAGDHVHIRFVDGAFVSVRPGSRLVVEDYRFDQAAPAQSRVKFDLQSGVARSITGQAGQMAKDRFRLNTPVAAIGIRGTDFSVLADGNESRVSVHSGAVVVAPLGNGCQADGVGPCAGEKARELTAEFANSFARVDRQRVEVLPPTGPVQTPDRVVPPAEHEPPTQRNAVGPERARNAAITDVAATRGAEVAVASALRPSGSENTAGPGTGAGLPSPGNTPVVPPVVAPPPVVLPPPALAWGRWSAVAWSGDATLAYAEASAGRSPTVGNDHFALFRRSEPFVLPTQGKASFTLQEAQVHLVNGAAAPTPGSISDAKLTMDFDAGRFSTSLLASHPAVAGGPVGVSASGLINADGIFLSGAQSNARVAGAISSGGTEAGYFFERQTGAGALIGITRWTR